MPLHHFSHFADKENECTEKVKKLYKTFDEIPQEMECEKCGKDLTKELGCNFSLRGGGWEKDGYQKRS
tara:strand:+ start:4707 stop:4910 length:204 start_codon:yes stop_codon:yes gene_type:complete